MAAVAPETELSEVRLHTAPQEDVPPPADTAGEDLMSITIRSGETVFPLRVARLDLVSHVKARVPDLDSHIGPHGCALVFDRVTLSDEATMEDSGVGNNAELLLVPRFEAAVPVGVPLGAPVAAAEGNDGLVISQQMTACSWAFIVLILSVLAWAVIATENYFLFLHFAIIFCPSLVLVKFWYSNRVETSLDYTIRRYMLGFLCAFPFMVMAFVFMSAFLMFVRSLFALIFAILFFALFIISFPEEYLKYAFTIKSFLSWRERRTADLIYATSAALGFATGEALFMVWQIARVSQLHLENGSLIRITALLVLFFVPLHCLTGYQTGLRLTLKEYLATHPDAEQMSPSESSVIGIIKTPVILRTVLICSWVFFESLDDVISWIGGVVMNIVICLVCLIISKRIEKRLPRDYLRRVGYLNVMGYGVLPDS